MNEAILPPGFFQRDAKTVARALIGCVLVRRLASGDVVRARVVETEAYVGAHDLACHASKGRTPRTEVMFRAGGVAYVYFIYGMYEMLNIVTGKENDAQAVLLRAAQPISGWPMGDEPDLSGPGKLTRALEITRALNGQPVTGAAAALYFEPRVGKPHILATPRIGVDYAGDWANEMLRFIDANSKTVSKIRRMKIKKKRVPGPDAFSKF